MTIRPATPADAEVIAAMLSRLANETGDGARFATTPDAIRSLGFGHKALFEALIAEQDGAAAGLALFFPHFSSIRGQPGVYVQDLWTDPGLRGRGLGQRLLATVADHARVNWRAGYLALTTHGHNDAARAFYARLGFEAHPDDVPMILDGARFAALRSDPEAVA
jgi:GNAT superfamily N-acetyltransferase